MLNVFAVVGQLPVVSIRFHIAGDDRSSLARCATATLHSRASATVDGRPRVVFVWARPRARDTRETAKAIKAAVVFVGPYRIVKAVGAWWEVRPVAHLYAFEALGSK